MLFRRQRKFVRFVGRIIVDMWQRTKYKKVLIIIEKIQFQSESSISSILFRFQRYEQSIQL